MWWPHAGWSKECRASRSESACEEDGERFSGVQGAVAVGSEFMEDAVEFFGGEDYGVASGEGEEVEAGELLGLGGEGEGLGEVAAEDGEAVIGEEGGAAGGEGAEDV